MDLVSLGLIRKNTYGVRTSQNAYNYLKQYDICTEWYIEVNLENQWLEVPYALTSGSLTF